MNSYGGSVCYDGVYRPHHISVQMHWVKPVPLNTGNWPQPKRLDDRWGHEVRTADGEEIVDGMWVWTNDLEAGFVDLQTKKPYKETNYNNSPPTEEWWFYVNTDRGYVLQSETRVSTRHLRTGKKA